MVVRPKANLTQIFDNHKDLQFSRMFYDLSYKSTGLKSSEQQILSVLMDRMQLSIKNNHFDKVAKRFYVNMCNEEIHEITGDGLGTISTKMKKLSDLGYITIERRKNHSNNIYLNFYHTGYIYTNNDLEYHFYLSLNSKIEGRKFKNRKAEIQKSKTSHSTYPYVLYPEGIAYRTEASKDNNSSIESKNKSSGKQSRNDYEPKRNKKSQKYQDTYAIIEGYKNSLNNKMPKMLLDTLEDVTKGLTNSYDGHKNIMEQLVNKIFDAKRDIGNERKLKDFLTWENNQQMINDFNNYIYGVITTAFTNKKVKSWKNYTFVSFKNFFIQICDSYEGKSSDNSSNKQYRYNNQQGYSSNLRNRGRKHIREKKRDWAKDNYQRRVKFEEQSPDIQDLIANNWNKASWNELTNDTRYVEIDENGLPYADSNGKFCKKPSASSLEKIYNATKEGMNKAEAKNKRDNFKAVRQFQNNYKENAKGYFSNVVNTISKNKDNSSSDQQRSNRNSNNGIGSKRKAELQEKLKNMENNKNEKNSEKSKQEEIDEALDSFGKSFTIYN